MSKLVYIASPLKGLVFKDEMMQEADRECPKFRQIVAKVEAKRAAKEVRKMGYTPISPILAFDCIYSEKTERKEVLEAGFELLKACYGIYVHKCAGWETSEGMKKEIELAKKLNIVTIEPDLTDEWLGH